MTAMNVRHRLSGLIMTASLLLAGLVLAACSDDEANSEEAAPVNAGAASVKPTDRALGDPGAPVTIIEYASVTCSHCAEFHGTTYKKIKEEYIDTGKVLFVFREFPTAPADRAIAGFLLARCLPEERYFPMIDVLMRTQPKWAFAEDSFAVLKNLAINSGLTEDQFTACLADKDGRQRIEDTVDEAVKKLDVTGTPSFIINGKKYSRAYASRNPDKTWENFQTIIDSLLE